MVYCQNSQSKTKAVTLVFKREELLYDAENYSFVEGDIMQAEDEHARHQVFDIGQDGNVDRVTRILNLVHSECVEMLFPYTKEEISDKQEPFIVFPFLIPQRLKALTCTLFQYLSSMTINLTSYFPHILCICFKLILALYRRIRL